MKIFFLVIAALSLSLVSSPSLLAQEKGDRAEVKRFLARFDRADAEKDVDFIDSVLADEFSYSSAYGTVESRKEFLDFYRSEKIKPTFKAISSKNENEEIRFYGDTAVKTASWTLLSEFPKAHPGSQPHEDKGRSTVILVKRGGSWKIALIHESEQQHDKAVMEKEVAALGRAYTVMIQKSEVAGIEKILADDYRVTDENGRVLTKEQDLATYKDRATTMKFDSVEYKGQDVRMITGSVAIDHSTIRFVGSRAGKPFDITERITTTWAFREGRWLIVADHFSFVK